MICKICNKEFGNKGFDSHIKFKHNLSSKEYFDLYEKSFKDGFCKICGKETLFFGATRGYAKYCGNKCAQLDPETRDKYKQTCLDKYGAENVYASEYGKQKIKEICLEKYGTEYANQSNIVKEHIKQSNLAHFGCENPQQSKEIKEKTNNTNLEKYGNKCAIHGKDQWKKSVDTMKKNGHYSKLELKLEQFFIDNHINYLPQYSDERYPFSCDFYLPDIDIFIEINVYWHHAGHWFNKNDQNDLKLLNIWKEKSKTKPSYKVAIDTWTNRDVQKKQYSKNLNYVVIWSKEELDNFINHFNGLGI